MDILLQHKVLESVVVPVPLQQTQNIQRSSDRFGACGNLIVAKEAFSLGPAGRDAEGIRDARKERFAWRIRSIPNEHFHPGEKCFGPE